MGESSIGVLVLWDADGAPDSSLRNIYTWNGWIEDERRRALLAYVETHGERLRDRYLAWVHDLGQRVIRGRRVIDHLAFVDGLSYWWMTPFVEQNPWKTPSITRALRLLALEEILREVRPPALHLVSGDRNLRAAVRGLCRGLGIGFRWERPLAPRRRPDWRVGYRMLPLPVQALVSLGRFLLARWPRRRAPARWAAGNGAVFFCSYFDNVDAKAASQLRFHSYYWDGLPALLSRDGRVTNWLQMFVSCTTVPTIEDAAACAAGFNADPSRQGVHMFVEAALSPRAVLGAIGRWCRLTWQGLGLRGFPAAFRPEGSHVSFWPIMRADWRSAMRGPMALGNLLWIELFDRSMAGVPHQSTGFYLGENQAWERAFVHAWRKYGHGRLHAVVHSTVRFWDLRFFCDPRTLREAGAHAMPRADVSVLNGPPAVNAYLGVSFPKDAMAEGEALRYGYLSDFTPVRPTRRHTLDPVRVLILGDYRDSDMGRVMRLLEAAARLLSAPARFTVKPHPNASMAPTDYPSLRLTITTEPLAQILGEFDVACSSSVTSASLDAYLAGLPVVMILDETELNFSPLRGCGGVRFVTTPADLAEALQGVPADELHQSTAHDFFFLDPSLPRWSHLLAG